MKVEPKKYRVPDSALPRVREFKALMLNLSERAERATQEYKAENARIIEALATLRKTISKEMCAACGIPYDPRNTHMLDASYVEHDIAFFHITAMKKTLFSDEEREEASTDMPVLPSIGGKLN